MGSVLKAPSAWMQELPLTSLEDGISLGYLVEPESISTEDFGLSITYRDEPCFVKFRSDKCLFQFLHLLRLRPYFGHETSETLKVEPCGQPLDSFKVMPGHGILRLKLSLFYYVQERREAVEVIQGGDNCSLALNWDLLVPQLLIYKNKRRGVYVAC